MSCVISQPANSLPVKKQWCLAVCQIRHKVFIIVVSGDHYYQVIWVLCYFDAGFESCITCSTMALWVNTYSHGNQCDACQWFVSHSVPSNFCKVTFSKSSSNFVAKEHCTLLTVSVCNSVVSEKVYTKIPPKKTIINMYFVSVQSLTEPHELHTPDLQTLILKRESHPCTSKLPTTASTVISMPSIGSPLICEFMPSES